VVSVTLLCYFVSLGLCVCFGAQEMRTVLTACVEKQESKMTVCRSESK